MNTTPVKAAVILGAGPSGLLAVHAAVRAGYVAHIYTAWDRDDTTQPYKSKIFGCQYLHEQIPDIRVRCAQVDYRIWGTPADYRHKVYGYEMAGEVSPEFLLGKSPAWDLRAAYDILWDRYVHNKHPMVVVIPERAINFDDVQYLQGCYPTIISTIPAPAICSGEHQFKAQEVWAIGDAPELGRQVPFDFEDNTVICNGLDGPNWYRGAKVFGYSTVEWSGKLRGRGSVAVQKPLESNCNCHPGVEKMGRYGQWRKGILTSDVFRQAEELFTNLEK
jgi:hypothetical protein